MRLDLATWREVETHLEGGGGVILPTGSTEQHGPMGLIGTDALCAQAIAEGAAKQVGAYVAPTLTYAPAAFNSSFPGTISISETLFLELANEIVTALFEQGFGKIYVLNGHGANSHPLHALAERCGRNRLRIRSWWEFEPVNTLRGSLFGDWEGMHATPSEVSITQAIHRIVAPGPAASPPEKLSQAYLAAHAGDRHGPAEAHRARFPDGRVGSHSALASPEHGTRLLDTAQRAVAEDYRIFVTSG